MYNFEELENNLSIFSKLSNKLSENISRWYALYAYVTFLELEIRWPQADYSLPTWEGIGSRMQDVPAC